MIDLGKKSVLGVMVDAVDYEAAVARIISAAEDRRPYAVSALAVHGVMTGVDDDEHRYRLNHFDLVTPDGQPVRWALNWLHRAGLKDRVYGPALTLKVCEAAADKGIALYLYGSRKYVLDLLVPKLKERFPSLRVVGAEPSKFRTISPDEKNDIVQRILSSGAGITLIGLGCPRQEMFAYEYRAAVAMPVIAVGAAFDYHAGLVTEPPQFLQRSGLQWLFRLCQEPSRLWRRYVLLNPRFMLGVLLQALQVRRRSHDDLDGAIPESMVA